MAKAELSGVPLVDPNQNLAINIRQGYKCEVQPLEVVLKKS